MHRWNKKDNLNRRIYPRFSVVHKFDAHYYGFRTNALLSTSYVSPVESFMEIFT